MRESEKKGGAERTGKTDSEFNGERGWAYSGTGKKIKEWEERRGEKVYKLQSRDAVINVGLI